MAKKFGISEHNLIKILLTQNRFVYNGKTYNVIFAGKPTIEAGEPKTDVFLFAESADHEKIPFTRKISFKQPNHDFIENKISATRAAEILGPSWSKILTKYLSELAPKFSDRKLIFKNNYGRTSAGSFTLGWKVEFLNKKNGELSLKMPLSTAQVIDIYSGRNLQANKRNAIINGQIIKNSGVADYILVGEDYESIEDILNKLVDIKTYVNEYPDIYLACKALNYRSFEKKFDGNRPLGAYVQWDSEYGKLAGKVVYDHPLEKRGNEVFEQLKNHMDKLHIQTSNDVDLSNTDSSIIFELK